MRRRFVALATGATPVVVKVAGFNKGGGTKDLVSYISREGQVKLENERGEVWLGPSVPGQVAQEWVPFISPRNETKDFATFTMEIAWQSSIPSQPASAFIGQALGNRAYAYAAEENEKNYTLTGLVVLNAGSGNRLEPNKKTANLIELSLRRELEDPNISVSLSFDDYGHGTRWASARLRNLVTEHPGNLRDEKGQVIETREAATKLVQRHWRNLAGTRTPRDMVHLIISVGKDSGYVALERSVRGFLAEEFQGHRYVFAIHDPSRDPKAEQEGGKRPHFHAHAVVTMMSDYGDRLNVWVTDMTRWRSILAEHGRANHLAVISVQRTEIASARAYTHHQVRPTSFAGRTEHRGTSSFADMRYTEKRIETPDMSAGEKGRANAQEARKVWQELNHPNYTAEIQQYANRMVYRFIRAEDSLEYRLAKRTAKMQQSELVGRTHTHQNIQRNGLEPDDPPRVPVHGSSYAESRDSPAHRLSPTASESGQWRSNDLTKSSPSADLNLSGFEYNSPVSAQPIRNSEQERFADFENDGQRTIRERFTDFFTAFKNALDAQFNPPSHFELEMARNAARHRLQQSILLSGQIGGMDASHSVTKAPIEMAQEVERDKSAEITRTAPAQDLVAKAEAENERIEERSKEQSRLEKSRSFDRDSYER